MSIIVLIEKREHLKKNEKENRKNTCEASCVDLSSKRKKEDKKKNLKQY